MMSSWWRDLIRQDDPRSEIIEYLPVVKDEVIRKNQYDCFYKTELDNLLSQSQTEQIIVTGVMTHLCCETTARSAFVRGYRVIFPADATATYNRGFHVAACRNLAHGFAHLVLSDHILETINES